MNNPSTLRRLASSHLLGWWLVALVVLILPAGVSASNFAGFAPAGKLMNQRKVGHKRSSHSRRQQRRNSKTARQRPTFREQGVLIEKSDGTVVQEEAATTSFNPASGMKLATTLFVLRALGPSYRFQTEIWTNGLVDASTGELRGNIYLAGRDLSLRTANVRQIASRLKQAGIKSVKGKIFVARTFTVDFQSAKNSAATFKQVSKEESIAISGDTAIGAVPERATLVATYTSAELVSMLKVMLCYSSNYMAERLGDLIGGAAGLERLLIAEGIAPEGLKVSSTSGLGVNRLTPRAMMRVLRSLVDELARHNLSLVDILPVAGIDRGTLFKRYRLSPSLGSIAAKTGTLIQTDRGASALVGIAATRSGGTLYFVIFHRRGHVPSMRARQDELIAAAQAAFAGPALLDYLPQPLLFQLGPA